MRMKKSVLKSKMNMGCHNEEIRCIKMKRRCTYVELLCLFLWISTEVIYGVSADISLWPFPWKRLFTKAVQVEQQKSKVRSMFCRQKIYQMYKSALCCPLKKGRGLMSTFVMALLRVRSEFEQWDCLKVAPFSWRVARPETWEAVSSDPYLDLEGGIHNKIQQGTMQIFLASHCWSPVKLETIVESLWIGAPLPLLMSNYL